METRKNTLQSVIDYFIDEGKSEFDVNILIHTNHPALGDENMNIVKAAQEGKWDVIWNFAELYIAGDLW